MNSSEKLIYNYKIDANLSLARVCRYVALLMVAIAILNIAGVFVIKGVMIYIVLLLSVISALTPTLVFNILKKQNSFAEYFVLTVLVCMVGIMYSILSYHSIIMLMFPIFCSCLYSEKSRILYTIGISVPMIIISHIVALYLNVVPDEPLVTMRGVILFGIIPRLIQLVAIGLIGMSISQKLHGLVSSLVQKNTELYENQSSLAESFSEIVEAKSQETGEHVKRVSEYTRILCEGLGYDEEKTWLVSTASMMHDVGKLLVPKEILEKPGKLTTEEFEQIKLHADYGRKMLEKSPGELMQISAVICYEHHERWDGTGYKQKKGEEINEYARCVALSDVFDALVSKRSYKRKWTAEEAYDEICAQSGKHFDPAIVEIFKKDFSKFVEILEKYPD